MADLQGFFTGLVYAAGSLVCHQLPERSFFWGGRQLPVCARCTSLYLSGMVGLIGWLAVRWRIGHRVAVEARRVKWLVIAVALPTLISVASGAIGLWDGTNITRAILALPLGLVAGSTVAAVLTKDLR